MKCPNCGAELNFDVSKKKVKCTYCNSTFDVSELKEKVKGAKEEIEGKCFTCNDCGAELLTFDDTAVTFCSYCGSQAILDSRLIKINNPDYVIPFNKTKEECIKEYKKKVNASLFMPSYMKKDIVLEKFRGIYMPYGVYDLSFHGKCSNSGSVYSHRSGDYVYYNDYDVKAQVDADYKGVSYDLSSKFRDDFSLEMPFDFHGAVPFNVNYLSGFYADTKDVQSETYDTYAKEDTRVHAKEQLIKKKEYRKYGVKNVTVPLQIENRKTGMFPVYFLSVRDKDNKHIHYAAVNGQTGDVSMDMPIDFKKYIVFSLILGILFFLLIDNFLVFTPKSILVFAMITTVINMIISRLQIKKLNNHEKYLDDLGMIVKNKITNEENEKKTNNKSLSLLALLAIIFGAMFGIPFFMFFGSIALSVIKSFSKVYEFIPIIIALFLILFVIRERRKKNGKLSNYDFFKTEFLKLIGLIFSILIYLVNSPYDEFYYGTSLILLAIVIISFYDIVKKHNLLASRPIPQLEKRGGKNE